MKFSKFLFKGAGRDTRFSLLLTVVVAVTFGLTVSLQYLLADWQPPSVAPPGGNLAKPIYSSSTVTQYITPIAPATYADLNISGGLSIRDGGYFGGPLLVGMTASQHIGWAETPLVDISGGPVHIQAASQAGLLLGDSTHGDVAVIQGLDDADPPTANSLILNPDGGNVGIGVNNPSWKLQVSAAGGNGILSSGGVTGVNGQGTSYGVGGLDSNNSSQGYLGYGNFGVYGNATWGVVGDGTNTGVYGRGGTYGVYGYGSTRGVQGCYTAACTHWGRLGNPSYGVTGDSYGGGGCDLAENYALAGDAPGLEAGDIVSLDSREGPAIKKSDHAYDTDIVGVISTAPSITMNVEDDMGDNHYPVALIGRVPTKVTAENGPIKIGDLVVSSSKPGYGMRCGDYDKCRGAVVGKALENLSSGEGKIEVLIKTGF